MHKQRRPAAGDAVAADELHGAERPRLTPAFGAAEYQRNGVASPAASRSESAARPAERWRRSPNSAPHVELLDAGLLLFAVVSAKCEDPREGELPFQRTPGLEKCAT